MNSDSNMIGQSINTAGQKDVHFTTLNVQICKFIRLRKLHPTARNWIEESASCRTISDDGSPSQDDILKDKKLFWISYAVTDPWNSMRWQLQILVHTRYTLVYQWVTTEIANDLTVQC